LTVALVTALAVIAIVAGIMRRRPKTAVTQPSQWVQLTDFVYRHSVVRGDFIAGQYQDHLQAREGTHKAAVLLAKPSHCFGHDEWEIHASLKQEVLRILASLS
jgi:hypothetical protein